MADNNHVREFLKYYCNLPKEPQYAVLLTGLWGSGKTWFIKDFIANHLLKSERVLYLSLYGVQSFDDIESELFRLLHPVLGSKPARILHRLLRGALKTSINFDLDGDEKSDGSVSGGIPTEKMLERVSLDPSKILVFDDLERCSIPTEDLLGYVNQFIEHGGIKAILIANEVELLKQTKETDTSYARIKEKLIGRTFEILPEVESALEHFADDLPTARSKEIVRANFKLITQVYECSEYKNLRLIRHTLWDFDRLLQPLDSDVLDSDPLLADLLALFLSYSLEVRSGAIKPSEIKKLQDSWKFLLRQNEDQPNPYQHLHDIGRKYSGLNLYSSLITDLVWEEIFSTGSIPKAELNESLLKSKYFQNKKQPNWVKLWYGTDLSDEEFSTVLAHVETEWNSCQYQNLGEVVHVTGLFIRYARHGIYNRTVENIIDSAKKYINHLLDSGEVPILQPDSRPSRFDKDSYAGLGFTSLEDEQFKAFLAYIDEQRQETLNASLPAQAESLLALIGTDTKLFYRRIILNNDQDNIYYRTPILHLIPPINFVKCLLSATPEDRKSVGYAFKERYSIQQFNEALLPELHWLTQVANQLRAEIKTRAGKVSSLSLGWVVDSCITQAISNLEHAKPASST